MICEFGDGKWRLLGPGERGPASGVDISTPPLLAGSTRRALHPFWRLGHLICRMGDACHLSELLPGATAPHCLSVKHSPPAGTG